MRHVLLWLAFTSLGGWLIGAYKRRPKPGFWLGLFFGPVGWVMTWILPRPVLKCPGCARPLQENAKSCPHCGRLFLDVQYRVHETRPPE